MLWHDAITISKTEWHIIKNHVPNGKGLFLDNEFVMLKLDIYERKFNMGDSMDRNVYEIAKGFSFEGELVEAKPWGNGHINSTFLLTYQTGVSDELKVILQMMNKNVFPKPVELMENVMAVTKFLHEKIEAAGGDPMRETLNVIPAKDGKPYYIDDEGEYWRAYVYITEATSFDAPETVEDFYESAYSFGKFQSMLSDYPAETLHETIEKFHDTRNRFANFKKALEADVMGRASEVQEEIKFVLEREADASVFVDLIEKGEIPIRVTHNDTKLNNIMMDNATRKGICVVDLDTVMPGLAMYDFGDSIRSGASTGAEDEKDLSKISCDMQLFEVYTKGFIAGCEGKLTKKEIELLPMGAKLMTYECGVRFLTDYLQGDVYFKIHRPEHNLDRARTQFKLVADMEAKWETMQTIVEKYNR